MSLPKSLAAKLLLLCQGEKMPASKLQYPLVQELLEEGILADSRSGRTKSLLFLPRPESLQVFLQHRYAIADLQAYVQVLGEEQLSWALLVQVAADSKAGTVRTFQGFLVNSYEPVAASLAGSQVCIQPLAGTFQFIHAWESFLPDPAVTIVGLENPENFSRIQQQRHLFAGRQVLFVSRYPQQQGKDLLRWLQRIPNAYLHFGDFDFAGIGIYLHEYKRHLGERASWFFPPGLEELLAKWGNKKLYDIQKINFRPEQVTEAGIREMIRLLHLYKRGLEQEALISGDH